MSLSNALARGVSLIGGAASRLRRFRDGSYEPAWGSAPTIPTAKPQGRIMTLKMPSARGWSPGQTPVAAPGLKVDAFATGLDHPRWLHVLPNGDVLVAESSGEPRKVMRHLFDHAMTATMKRARAAGVSANRITLLRDTDGDGVAETCEPFLTGLSQPFGMALVEDKFYVGNTDGIFVFPYAEGTTRIAGPGRKLVDFKPGGHWTRSLLVSADGRKLYAGVGSLSNIGDDGMAVEEDGHRQRLIDLHRARFGEVIPLIRREHVAGFYARRPVWLAQTLTLDSMRGEAAAMEKTAHDFYVRAAARTQEALDAAIDQAVLTITAQDARGYFTHDGYSLAQSR